PYDPTAYGAYPTHEFDHQERPRPPHAKRFEAPSLALGIGRNRLVSRVALLQQIDRQRSDLERETEVRQYDRYQQDAVSLLTGSRIRRALDVFSAEPRVLDRYGRNSFGWSLLMARRLVEAGVSLVQVNLGNNETWDTHGNAFSHLRDNLFPPTDRAVSALLDDLHDSSQLDSTLVVMA